MHEISQISSELMSGLPWVLDQRLLWKIWEGTKPDLAESNLPEYVYDYIQ